MNLLFSKDGTIRAATVVKLVEKITSEKSYTGEREEDISRQRDREAERRGMKVECETSEKLEERSRKRERRSRKMREIQRHTEINKDVETERKTVITKMTQRDRDRKKNSIKTRTYILHSSSYFFSLSLQIRLC